MHSAMCLMSLAILGIVATSVTAKPFASIDEIRQEEIYKVDERHPYVLISKKDVPTPSEQSAIDNRREELERDSDENAEDNSNTEKLDDFPIKPVYHIANPELADEETDVSSKKPNTDDVPPFNGDNDNDVVYPVNNESFYLESLKQIREFIDKVIAGPEGEIIIY